jgi:hypothetical protein
MLLTALPPAPPTPNTTMRGFNSVVRGADSEIAMEFSSGFARRADARAVVTN